MEVEDVSHVVEWMQLLKKQKVAFQGASKRNGERPKDRKSRGQLIHEFMLQNASMKLLHQEKNDHMIHQSWVAAPYPPSVAPLSGLKKLYLNDMQLETHHRGFYALLRVATPPVIMTAVMAIMEDEKDHVVVFQLFQQEDKDHRPGEEVVQKNRVCIAKEPYFKVMNDGGYGLRVDHLSDVVWLSPHDERIPLGWRARRSDFEKTAEILKEEGNLALRAGKLNSTIERYALSLPPSPSHNS